MGGTTTGTASAGFFVLPEKKDREMVKINGKEENAAGQTVAVCLETSGFDAARVVVEINEEIVPKDRYSDTVLRDGDQVEIVCFMGGG